MANYRTKGRVPVGFALKCICTVGGSQEIMQRNVSHKVGRFEISLPPMGEYACCFYGQNDVWKTGCQVSCLF